MPSVESRRSRPPEILDGPNDPPSITGPGIEQLPRLIRELRERNVSLVSHHEPRLNGSDATTELLAAVAAWVATQESVRRSERSLAHRRAQGKPMGGAASKRGKDKHPRRTEGYKQAWARRKAAE